MRLASVTSCSAVSSGTLPISFRYMRTGSKLPPLSLCVGRCAARTETSSGSGSSYGDATRDPAPGRGAALGRCSARRAGGAGATRRRGDTAPLVFELELFGDLVEHLHAVRLEHLPEVAQLVGVGLEIGERGEDLAGGDEAALAHLREHVVDGRRRRSRRRLSAACSRRRRRSVDRTRRVSGSGVCVIGDPRYQLLGDGFGRIPMLGRSRVRERVEQRLDLRRARIVTSQHRREQTLT